MANATLKGVVTAIFQSEIYGSFEKRVFWLEEQEEKYASTWQIECHQGDCSILDNFQAGEYVECSINIRGRIFDRKDGSGQGVINTLKCWKIVLAQPDQLNAPHHPQYRQPQQQQPQQRTYSQPQQRSAVPQQQYRQPAQQQRQQPEQDWQQPEQQPEEDDNLPF